MLLFTGCVTATESLDSQLNAIYEQINTVFDSCTKTTSISNISQCGREFLENHQRLPDTYQKPPWVNYANRLYTATIDLQYGRIKSWGDFNAAIQPALKLWESEMNYAVARENQRLQADGWRRLGEAGRAYNEAMRQQQPTTCVSRPNAHGTIVTVCQ